VKKIVLIFLIALACSDTQAQMYPWFTQYRSNMYMYNPAFCGTKRFIDFRLFYRNQWNGFKGAPVTYASSLSMRLMDGAIGLGGFVFNDEIGPFKNINVGGTFAFHLRLDDVELSFGFQGNYLQQTFDGNKITLHNSIDRAINQTAIDKQSMYDGSFGVVLLNDRFYFGLAANNFVGNQMSHYAGDPFYNGKYKNETSYSVGVGYNYAENPNYTFENSIMALYTGGVPFYLDYTLRLHINKVLLTGISVRLQDAVALHLGFNIQNQFQVAYSYDIITSPLKKYSGGSHEISVVFSSNLGRDEKKKGFNGRFLKQKFQYLL
jgi:type IX secretion system PorP/SprF family membrane protein